MHIVCGLCSKKKSELFLLIIYSFYNMWVETLCRLHHEISATWTAPIRFFSCNSCPWNLVEFSRASSPFEITHSYVSAPELHPGRRNHLIGNPCLLRRPFKCSLLTKDPSVKRLRDRGDSGRTGRLPFTWAPLPHHRKVRRQLCPGQNPPGLWLPWTTTSPHRFWHAMRTRRRRQKEWPRPIERRTPPVASHRCPWTRCCRSPVPLQSLRRTPS